MRLQDRNMIGGAGVSLQKNGASGILFQFVKDLIHSSRVDDVTSMLGSSSLNNIFGISRSWWLTWC